MIEVLDCTAMNDDHFLTTEEVLDYLQVNLRTIYRLIKAGKISKADGLRFSPNPQALEMNLKGIFIRT